MVFDAVFRFEAVGVGGVTIDLTALGAFSAAYLHNKGASNVFWRYDATIPPASFGNDRVGIVTNGIVNLEDILFTALSLRSAAASNVEIIFLIRVGAGGIG